MTPRHKLRIAAMIAALAGLSLAISAMPGPTASPPAASMMRADFTWTDQHSGSHAWSFGCNWSNDDCDPGGPIPDDENDTATFPDNSETDWTVVQGTYTIGTVTCEEGVDFAATTNTTLTIKKLVIDATGRTNAIDVKMSESTSGQIIANP